MKEKAGISRSLSSPSPLDPAASTAAAALIWLSKLAFTVGSAATLFGVSPSANGGATKYGSFPRW